MKWTNTATGKTIEIYNEDCMPALEKMQENEFELAIVDPPYGINYYYNTYNDTIENLEAIISHGVPNILRIAKRTLLFCNHKNLFKYPQPDWIFCYSWNTTGSYGKLGVCQWQPVLFYGKDIKGFGSINNVLKSDFVNISGGAGVGFMRKENIEHSCPKPLNIIKYIVARFSNEGDKIIDPFLGSGTTAIACHKMNRECVGYEIDKYYYEATCKRLNDHFNQQTLF